MPPRGDVGTVYGVPRGDVGTDHGDEARRRVVVSVQSTACRRMMMSVQSTATKHAAAW